MEAPAGSQAAADPSVPGAASGELATAPNANEAEFEDWEDDERGYIFEDRLGRGDEHKAIGNDHFKKGEWGLALRRYRRALFHAGFDETQMFDLMDHHREMAHNVQVPVKLNLVACILKHRELNIPLAPFRVEGAEDEGETDPLDYCELLIQEVIKCEPKSAKAYFRRGQLLVARGDPKGAEEALAQAEKLQGGGGGGVREAMRKVKQLQREERAREKQMFAGFIQGSSDYKAVEQEEERRQRKRYMMRRVSSVLLMPLTLPVSILRGVFARLVSLVAQLVRIVLPSSDGKRTQGQGEVVGERPHAQ